MLLFLCHYTKNVEASSLTPTFIIEPKFHTNIEAGTMIWCLPIFMCRRFERKPLNAAIWPSAPQMIPYA